jgi:hypothetical protein
VCFGKKITCKGYIGIGERKKNKTYWKTSKRIILDVNVPRTKLMQLWVRNLYFQNLLIGFLFCVLFIYSFIMHFSFLLPRVHMCMCVNGCVHVCLKKKDMVVGLG